MVTSLFFYLFSFIITACAVMVISSRNPVHSVLFLILAFFNSGALFIILGAEFLAMMLVIVYVGAVAVLFLFVVMMLNVAEQKGQWFSSRWDGGTHIPVGLLVSLIIFFELIIVIGGWKYKPDLLNSLSINISTEVTNTRTIGNVLYTDYILLFQISGMILLVAMIGAIVLTYRERAGVKRQSYVKQISRERDEGVDLVEAERNKGVKIDA